MFHAPNIASIKLKLKSVEDKKVRSEIRYTKPEFGSNKFVILPPYSERGLMSKTVYTHFMGPQDKKVPVFCPELTEPTKKYQCPICFVLQVLRNQGKDVKPWIARSKANFNVIPLQIGGEAVDEDTPQLAHILQVSMGISTYIDEKLLDDDYAGFYDPSSALPILITKKKTGKRSIDVEYKAEFARKAITITEDDATLKEISESLYNLDKIYSYREDIYKKSIEEANELLDVFGFEKLEESDYPEFPPELIKSDDTKTEEVKEEKQPVQPEEEAPPVKKSVLKKV